MANVPSATRNGTIMVVKGVPIADCSIRKNVFLWRISCLFKRQRKSKERLLLVRYFDHDDKGKETRLDDSVLDFVLNKFYVVLESGLVNKTSFGISRKFRNHIGPAMILWKTHFPRDFRLHQKDNNMPPNAAEIEDFLCFITDSLRLIKTVLRTDNFLYVIDGIEQERVFFLNLSFLPDEFFGTEEKDDPFLHVAKSFCTSEKIYHPPIRLLQQTFKTTAKYKELANTMEGKAMQVFPFKNYTDSLKYSKLDLPNVKPFWHMIKSLLLPGYNDVSSNNDRVIPHTATMLFTNSGKNGYPKPQKPHQDYTPTECERETPMPWGMIMSLSLGGNCLNVWDNCADEKHAIHLSIPFKFIFLMRGDIVHGGALDNS